MPKASSSGQRKSASEFNSVKVTENYFGDKESGLTTAIRGALKKLFTDTRLPDNPYLYLANLLGAYVDHTPIWIVNDRDLLSSIDLEGGIEVVEANTKLSRTVAEQPAWGLPHILRFVSKDGVKVLRHLLYEGLPASFCPGPSTALREGGYAVQLLCSIQGCTAIWQPHWLLFPTLDVRVDVLVRGSKLDEALLHFADLVLDDCEDLNSAPVYHVEALHLELPPGDDTQGARLAAASQRLTLADVAANESEFYSTFTRAVLAGRRVRVELVLLLEVAAPSSRGAAVHESAALRFKPGSKTYCFHFQQITTDANPAAGRAAGGVESVVHFGSGAAQEALYGGYFLDLSAARQYLQLFGGGEREPYARRVLEDNLQRLEREMDAALCEGHSLDALRRALVVAALADTAVVRAGPLAGDAALLALEDLVLGARRGPLTAIPDLLRCVNAGAAVIEGVVWELGAVASLLDAWPAKLAELQRLAAAAPAAAPVVQGAVADGQAGATVEGDWAEEDEQLHGDMLTWLSSFQLERKLLLQLQDLRRRAEAAAGRGLFSGLSHVMTGLLERLPAAHSAGGDARDGGTEATLSALLSIRSDLTLLGAILNAASRTWADRLADRCPTVAALMSAAGLGGALELSPAARLRSGEAAHISWVLPVQAVTEAQVRAGALCERVAVEGVMLQYCVDTKLDELLVDVYDTLTRPPLVHNPYPRLMDYLRERSARLGLWREDPEEGWRAMQSDTAMWAAPSFMYAAWPPQRASRAQRLRGNAARIATAMGGADDRSMLYGCYAAVTLADCRVLHALADSLAGVLPERHWQAGAYAVEALPALTGDAALSAAMGLADADEAAALAPDQSSAPGRVRARGGDAGGGGGGAYVAGPLQLHSRWCEVEAEEHLLVSGPHRGAAAHVFAEGVVNHAVQLHTGSPHVVTRIALTPHAVQQNAAVPVFQVADLAADASARADAVAVLADAACHCRQGRALGSVRMYVCVRDGTYLALTKHVVFQHSTAPGGDDETLPTGSAEGVYDDEHTRLEAERWDDAVFARLFMSEAAAALWSQWNWRRGDPAQPFHFTAFAQRCSGAAGEARKRGDNLAAAIAELRGAVALAAPGPAFHLARCMQTPARELRCLQQLSSALLELMGPGQREEVVDKLERERLRRMVLTYAARARKYLSSPQYCYFSGFAALAAQHLPGLVERILATFRLTDTDVEALAQLDALTRCCELGVAASLDACLRDVLPGGLDALLSQGEWAGLMHGDEE